jgi:predicted Zn-dependent protease
MNTVTVQVLFVVLLGLALAGCETVQTTQGSVVGVDRTQSMLVSSAEVNQAAAEEYKKVLAQASQQGRLNRNPQEVQRVRAITQRLIPNTAAFRTDAPGWKWEANVIADDQVNAWCMPGGKIAVYSGLIEKLQLTDDELAAIMGHEIAHALREHSREQISQKAATGLAVGVASAVLGLGDVGSQLGNMVADVTFNLPRSRNDEVEADRIGVELAARAGYDPRGAVAVWQKMLKNTSGGPPQFLSTHPSSESRLRDLQVYADRVMPLYQSAKR